MSQVFYAVRTGKGRGLYRNWGEARDNDFANRQTAGNAAKFNNKEDAENWMKKNPIPEGFMKVIDDLLRIVASTFGIVVLAILLTFAIFVVVQKIDNYFECSRFINLLHPVCSGTAKILMTVRTESLKFLISALTYTMTSIIGGYAFITGLLPKITNRM